jgi:hypothetical protein
MVCSETSRWALIKAGQPIPETRSPFKKLLGVYFGPANFFMMSNTLLSLQWKLQGERKISYLIQDILRILSISIIARSIPQFPFLLVYRSVTSSEKLSCPFTVPTSV